MDAVDPRHDDDCHGLGLALSGGGSRAAAFHRGTLHALRELGHLDAIDVLSTVSGGSLFGAAWMSSRADGHSDEDFLHAMTHELARGFIARSFELESLKLLIPGHPYSRTNAIANCFDRIFFRGKTLSELPEHPKLCINTSVMNSGELGKFYREGFTTPGIRTRDGLPETIPMRDFPIALAVGASAAFPVGLPPIVLPIHELRRNYEFELTGKLADIWRLVLTDGGVLENIGSQSLLQGRFRAWDLIVSDADVYETPWHDRRLLNTVRGFLTWLFSGRTLDRVMLMMNTKQNHWSRAQLVEELEFSWLRQVHCALEQGTPPSLEELLRRYANRPRRKLMLVRVNKDWRGFMGNVPRYRLLELAGGDSKGLPEAGDAKGIEDCLEGLGVDLSRAREHYARMGGDERFDVLKCVKTNFLALDECNIVTPLGHHAAWQVHASAAIFGIGD